MGELNPVLALSLICLEVASFVVSENYLKIYKMMKFIT